MKVRALVITIVIVIVITITIFSVRCLRIKSVAGGLGQAEHMENETIPQTQRALKVEGAGKVELKGSCELPAVEDDEVLIRVRSVSINPVDVKMLDMAPNINATVGCEFSGDVVRVGPKVKNPRIKVGVAVFGCQAGNHPSRPDNGAYAEFVAMAGDLLYILPPHFTYQQGASLAVPLKTTGLALYSTWPLPLPWDAATPEKIALDGDRKKRTWVLVYGGSTVCGAMALQLLRLAGLSVVCTCSPRSFALVKKLGALEAFDYHEPTCADKIREFTGDQLAFVLDCITDLDSTRLCYASMGTAGGKYMGLDPVLPRAHTRRDVHADYVLVYTILGKAMPLPRPYGRPAQPRDRAFAEKWVHNSQKLVDQPGQLQAHPIEDVKGGLATISKGLDRMRKGSVKGTRLVYEISEGRRGKRMASEG